VNIGHLGVWTTELRFGDSSESRDAAAELDDLGFGAIWLPGLDGTGILEVVERQLQATKRLTVATGVIGIWGTTQRRWAPNTLGCRLNTGIDFYSDWVSATQRPRRESEAGTAFVQSHK
jgi:hypothetical protein